MYLVTFKSHTPACSNRTHKAFLCSGGDSNAGSVGISQGDDYAAAAEPCVMSARRHRNVNACVAQAITQKQAAATPVVCAGASLKERRAAARRRNQSRRQSVQHNDHGNSPGAAGAEELEDESTALAWESKRQRSHSTRPRRNVGLAAIRSVRWEITGTCCTACSVDGCYTSTAVSFPGLIQLWSSELHTIECNCVLCCSPPLIDHRDVDGDSPKGDVDRVLEAAAALTEMAGGPRVNPSASPPSVRVAAHRLLQESSRDDDPESLLLPKDVPCCTPAKRPAGLPLWDGMRTSHIMMHTSISLLI